MTLQRMDNVLIVVEDLEAAKAFFAELGMELEGETQVEGPYVDSTVGLHGVRADITMMRTPDGHGRVELTRYHTPPAVRLEPEDAPANALGIRRIMFTVDDIEVDGVAARGLSDTWSYGRALDRLCQPGLPASGRAGSTPTIVKRWRRVSRPPGVKAAATWPSTACSPPTGAPCGSVTGCTWWPMPKGARCACAAT